ncbi:hypothetical protein Droror1_Dr00024290 [Drosera rotundifolia]
MPPPSTTAAPRIQRHNNQLSTTANNALAKHHTRPKELSRHGTRDQTSSTAAELHNKHLSRNLSQTPQSTTESPTSQSNAKVTSRPPDLTSTNFEEENTQAACFTPQLGGKMEENGSTSAMVDLDDVDSLDRCTG